MNYPETLTYLAHLGESRMAFGLETMKRALEAMGGNSLPCPTVIVGGTNGKGSTCGFIESILSHAGFRAGLFTSPHLESPRERIRISGREITDEAFAACATLIHEHCSEQGLTPTYFEFLTLMAFHHFRHEAVDHAIFEVGLGGKLDATNALDPTCSILTKVDLDHMELLGSTRELIASDKVRIFRSHRPAITCVQATEVAHVITQHAQSIEAVLQSEQTHFQVSMHQGLFSYEDDRLRIENIRLGTVGDHQRHNAGMATRYASILGIETTSIIDGLIHTHVSGRMECWTKNGRPDVWLDVAHNPDSAQSVVDHFFSLDQPLTLLLGMLADKNWREVLSILSPLSKRMIFTAPNSPRSWNEGMLRDVLSKNLWVPNPADALSHALEQGNPVLALGSFYLIGVLRPYLREQGYGIEIVND